MTPNRAQFLRAFCIEFGARAPESFWQASESELATACNGVGPEHWPPWARAVLSVLLRPLEASATIHDWEYSLPHKTFRAFAAANIRLASNVMFEAVYECRPACMLTGILAAFLCQIFGWHAYRNGRTSPPLNRTAALRADTQRKPCLSRLCDSKPQAETVQCQGPNKYSEGKQ